MRIPFQTIYEQFLRILLANGCPEQTAVICADIFTQNSRDGVYSHGLNMFPLFIKNIQNGVINVRSTPLTVQDFGAFLVLDGQSGPGPSNAYLAMEQAINLAEKHGMGCTAMRNTNHWTRAGAYVIQAADADCIGICWTNTLPNMPAWGAKQVSIGNNPLAIALPRPEGHLVLDIAMSQFSFGKMRFYQKEGQSLPVYGGYDDNGNLTTDPGKIINNERALPIGYWKGSGIAIMLDLIAAILSGGNTTFRIGHLGSEQKVSQIFIAIHTQHFADFKSAKQLIEETINSLHQCEPAETGQDIYYPGQRMLMTREDNMKNGIPVDPEIWQKILTM